MTVPTPSPDRYADVEDLLEDWLKNVLGYPNITNELPTNLVFEMPLLVVERFGGPDSVITLDKPNVDIDVLASNRKAAKDHAISIWSAMRTRLPGYVYNNTTQVKGVRTISAPARAEFDSRSTVRRFTFAVQIDLHQFAGVH